LGGLAGHGEGGVEIHVDDVCELGQGCRTPSGSSIRAGPRPSGQSGPMWVVTAARSGPRPAANRCLDVNQDASTNGTWVITFQCTLGDNQLWY
jgi:hypothetical protein